MHMPQFTMDKCTLVILACLVLVFGLPSVYSQPQIGSRCKNPNLILGPEQVSSLQQLNSLPPGTVIQLKAGLYKTKTNFVFSKNLTLCGAGSQETILDGSEIYFQSIISISNDKDELIEVTLEDLAITNGRGILNAGFYMSGRRTKVNLRHVTISGHEGFGILGVANQSQLTLQGVEIFNNGQDGLNLVGEDLTAVLQDVLVLDNGNPDGSCTGVALAGKKPASFLLQDIRIIAHRCIGLGLSGEAQVKVQNAHISNNGIGIMLQGQIKASLRDVWVKSNSVNPTGGEGILVTSGFTRGASPQVSLQRVRVSYSAQNGLLIKDSSVVELVESILDGNGVHPMCQKTGDNTRVCNGLAVQDQAQVTVMDSTIRANTDWGVGAYLKQCGYEADLFTGNLIFGGKNVIELNSQSSNQKGMGNPGNHPFKNLPDGNVCLP